MNYKPLIESSYKELQYHDEDAAKAEFILSLFNIYPYESGDNADFLAEKVLGVITAITKRTTFEYHKNEPSWYIAVCHLPEIANKIFWGTSIRGAFWECEIKLDTCSLFYNGNQILNKKFTGEDFGRFTLDLHDFYTNDRG